jgi:carbon storage regulator
MLVLTRRIGQSIVISGSIHVHVLSVQQGRVKIGISAPAEVRVVRQELLERKGTEKGGLTNPEAG